MANNDNDNDKQPRRSDNSKRGGGGLIVPPLPASAGAREGERDETKSRRGVGSKAGSQTQHRQRLKEQTRMHDIVRTQPPLLGSANEKDGSQWKEAGARGGAHTHTAVARSGSRRSARWVAMT